MMTPKRRRQTGPILLIVIGVGVMLTGLGLHWWAEAHGQKHTLEWIPQFIGAFFIGAGFYRIDPNGTKDYGTFVLDAGTRIVGLMRPGGRRATDPPVVTPIADASHVPAPDIPPTGGFPPRTGE